MLCFGRKKCLGKDEDFTMLQEESPKTRKPAETDRQMLQERNYNNNIRQVTSQRVLVANGKPLEVFNVNNPERRIEHSRPTNTLHSQTVDYKHLQNSNNVYRPGRNNAVVQRSHSAVYHTRPVQRTHSTHRHNKHVPLSQAPHFLTLPLQTSQASHNHTKHVQMNQASQYHTLPAQTSQASHNHTLPAQTSQASHNHTKHVQINQASHNHTLPAQTSQAPHNHTKHVQINQTSHNHTLPAQASQASHNGTKHVQINQASQYHTLPAQASQASHNGTKHVQINQASLYHTLPAQASQASHNGTKHVNASQASHNHTKHVHVGQAPHHHNTHEHTSHFLTKPVQTNHASHFNTTLVQSHASQYHTLPVQTDQASQYHNRLVKTSQASHVHIKPVQTSQSPQYHTKPVVVSPREPVRMADQVSEDKPDSVRLDDIYFDWVETGAEVDNTKLVVPSQSDRNINTAPLNTSFQTDSDILEKTLAHLDSTLNDYSIDFHESDSTDDENVKLTARPDTEHRSNIDPLEKVPASTDSGVTSPSDSLNSNQSVTFKQGIVYKHGDKTGTKRSSVSFKLPADHVDKPYNPLQAKPKPSTTGPTSTTNMTYNSVQNIKQKPSTTDPTSTTNMTYNTVQNIKQKPTSPTSVSSLPNTMLFNVQDGNTKTNTHVPSICVWDSHNKLWHKKEGVSYRGDADMDAYMHPFRGSFLNLFYGKYANNDIRHGDVTQNDKAYLAPEILQKIESFESFQDSSLNYNGRQTRVDPRRHSIANY